MASEPGPGGSATTTIRARSQGPSSRRAGQIAPLISKTLPLAAGASAIRELGERSSVGKIVLTV